MKTIRWIFIVVGILIYVVGGILIPNHEMNKPYLDSRWDPVIPTVDQYYAIPDIRKNKKAGEERTALIIAGVVAFIGIVILLGSNSKTDNTTFDDATTNNGQWN